jgi:hypothetical protein
MRGLANYYGLAMQAKSGLRKLYYLWHYSLLKTLAAKHRTTVRQTAKQRQQGRDLVSSLPGQREDPPAPSVRTERHEASPGQRQAG